jgi:hypothetical protein
MIKKNIILEKNQYDELCKIINTFADKRYIISEEKKNSKTIYTIFDRKAESGVLVGMLDMFTSRTLIPKRFRIIVEIYEIYDRLDINISGDVLMLDWNIVEHNPKRRDQIRLENILEDLIIKINKIKN